MLLVIGLQALLYLQLLALFFLGPSQMTYAWTGSEHVTILPKAEGLGESLKDLFPVNISHFFHEYYDTKMLLLSQRDTGWDPSLLWKKSDFEYVIDAFANYSRHVTVYKMRNNSGVITGWAGYNAGQLPYESVGTQAHLVR